MAYCVAWLALFALFPQKSIVLTSFLLFALVSCFHFVCPTLCFYLHNTVSKASGETRLLAVLSVWRGITRSAASFHISWESTNVLILV